MTTSPKTIGTGPVAAGEPGPPVAAGPPPSPPCAEATFCGLAQSLVQIVGFRLLQGRTAGAAVAAQQRGHTRDQLTHREGLGHVVVGAAGQTLHEVLLGVPGREHEHRDIHLLLDPTAHLPPVHAREHEVEHHRVGGTRQGRRHGCGPVMDHLHLPARGAQTPGHLRGDVHVVLHHEDARRRVTLPRRHLGGRGERGRGGQRHGRGLHVTRVPRDDRLTGPPRVIACEHYATPQPHAASAPCAG